MILIGIFFIIKELDGGHDGYEDDADIDQLSELVMPNELPRHVNKVKPANESKKNKYDNIDVENTEHMLAYKTTIKLYGAFSKLFGVTVGYGWKPTRSVMFWLTNILLFVVWFSIVYTGYFHYMHGNLKRILEPLAIIGISSSVIIIETSSSI